MNRIPGRCSTERNALFGGDTDQGKELQATSYKGEAKGPNPFAYPLQLFPLKLVAIPLQLYKMACLLYYLLYKIRFMKKIMQQCGVGLLVFMIVAITSCNSTNRVTDADTGYNIKQANDSSWIFTPIDVMPQYGAPRHADGNFSVNYSPKKLVVYLPYFGRAYSGADVFSRTGPLDFTSNKFTMTKREGKKGHVSITIKPTDYNEVQSMNFTFYSNGSANLTVTLTNRTGISFTGTVTGFK